MFIVPLKWRGEQVAHEEKCFVQIFGTIFRNEQFDIGRRYRRNEQCAHMVQLAIWWVQVDCTGKHLLRRKKYEKESFGRFT